jgi:two-component system LytT family response regulator
VSAEARLRAVIVEDEPQARASLRDYAGEVEWLTLVGEAGDGKEAIRVIDSVKPELVFLDISLPEASGLEVIERIRHKPDVVFTTAHDQYALAAFEIGAVDYLLKPFGQQRFHTMLERVRQRLGTAVPATERARTAFERPLRRLFARTRAGIVPIDVRTVQHLSASGDYVEVHTGAATYLLHTSLGELMARLDAEMFRQVHRSHAVNLEAVEKMVPFDSRRLLIRMRGGSEILASREASEMLRALAR